MELAKPIADEDSERVNRYPSEGVTNINDLVQYIFDESEFDAESTDKTHDTMVVHRVSYETPLTSNIDSSEKMQR